MDDVELLIYIFLVASNFYLKVVLVAGKLIAERGNASFPSFVRWLTSKVLSINHHHNKETKRIFIITITDVIIFSILLLIRITKTSASRTGKVETAR